MLALAANPSGTATEWDVNALVPLPVNGRIYRDRQLVGPGDAAVNGRAHLDAIVRWIQEVAYADVADAELSDPGAWVVRRSHVLIRKAPQFAERLELSTFCSAVGASVAERRTRITGNRGADVDAAVLWVHIDEATRMPAGFTDEFISIYAPSADGRRARPRLYHPKGPPEDAETSSWRFGTADSDLADHVNNVAFIRIVADVLLGDSARDGLDLEGEYRAPTPPGDVSVRTRGEQLWVVDGDEAPYASFRLASIRT